MKKKMVLVAHRAGAALYEQLGSRGSFKLLAQIEHPQGRLRTHEINSDRQGHAGLSNFSSPLAPRDHLARHFAHQLAELLERRAYHNEYQRLVIVAEPRLLGLLRPGLGPNTLRRLAAALPKDLGRLDPLQLKAWAGKEALFSATAA